MVCAVPLTCAPASWDGPGTHAQKVGIPVCMQCVAHTHHTSCSNCQSTIYTPSCFSGLVVLVYDDYK